MKRPNFFILGAPKSGTTSMAEWLRGHPRIFMTSRKEPFFFCTDLIPERRRNLVDYERLFEEADERYEIVGEASTDYLFSRTAVPSILKYSQDPRFLVMLRNPIEMAPALHGEKLYQGDEHVADFEEAWALQGKRARQPAEAVTYACRDPQLLMYGPFCRVGEQLERLYEHVPHDTVKVVLLDDVKEDPRREYLGVLSFLGLEDDGRRDFPVLNVAKTRRSAVLHRVTRILGNLRMLVGSAYRGFGILNHVSRWNQRKKDRRPLSSEMRATLVDYFRDDVERLGELLNRDLGAWLDPASPR